ncbi:unnamed protein product [Discula destructiva]
MSLLILFLAMLGLLGSYAKAQVLDGACNCSRDQCLWGGNYACWVNGTSDQELGVDHAPTGMQACENGTYINMMGVDGVSPISWANVTECQLLMLTFFDPTYDTNYLLASQLWNSSAMDYPTTKYGGCYLFIGGGAGATPEAMALDDTFFIGNMDLAYAVSNAIINFANDGNSSLMSVCGTLPNCGFNNTATGVPPSVTPNFDWCLGGASLGADWRAQNGSYGFGLGVVLDEHNDLSISAVPDNAPVDNAAQNTSTALIVHEDNALTPPAQPTHYYVLSCSGRKEKVWTLQRCVIYFDARCDANGHVNAGSFECIRRCRCARREVKAAAKGGVCYVGGKGSSKCIRDVEDEHISDQKTSHLIGAGVDSNDAEAA